MVEQRITLGTWGMWALMRGLQLILPVMLFAVVAQRADATSMAGIAGYAVAAALTVMLMLFLHDAACAMADEQGIYFRRYGPLRTMSWSDVARVQWAPFQYNILRMELLKPIEGSRNLQLYMPVDYRKWPRYWRGDEIPQEVTWAANRVRNS